MKLDVTCMRYLTKDDYRVLVAVEMGMRNHEMVPVNLITSIAQLRHGGSYRILSTLLRHKLVAHALQEYDGYRLSYLGYDILALHTLQARGIITSVGNQIGVGKESDIFEAMDKDGNEVVVKIHRLGRTSFRAVRKTRDYLKNKSKASWLYMSRLAALKEFAFMKALYAHDFPVPIPIDQNRHVVVMSRVNGFPMAQIKSGKLDSAPEIFRTCMNILRKLAIHGLIHCDFNEFNLMISNDGKITLIDFPQMVSTSHLNASELLERDINCLIKFFVMKMKYLPNDEELFKLEDLIENNEVRIDEEIRASGFDAENNENIMDLELMVNYDGISQEDTEEVNVSSEEQQIVAEEGEREVQNDTASNESEDNDDDEEEGGDDGENAEQQPPTTVFSSPQEKLSEAYARLRSEILKKNKGHKGKGNHSEGHRNHTKKRNKYGKIVKGNAVKDDW